MTHRRLHKKKRCTASGKRRYETKLDCLLDNERNPRTIRAYKCPDCGDWHGTSKPEWSPVEKGELVAVAEHSETIRQRLYKSAARGSGARVRRPPRRHGRPRGR